MHGTYSRNEKHTALGYGCCCCYCSLQSRVTRSGRFPPPIGNLGRALTHQSGERRQAKPRGMANRAPDSRGQSLWWANHRQRHIGPTNDLGPTGGGRTTKHCRPALEVRRLRTAPDGWNCCCNCCCHGEMRCGVDTSAGQPCATAPRE